MTADITGSGHLDSLEPFSSDTGVREEQVVDHSESTAIAPMPTTDEEFWGNLPEKTSSSFWWKITLLSFAGLVVLTFCITSFANQPSKSSSHPSIKFSSDPSSYIPTRVDKRIVRTSGTDFNRFIEKYTDFASFPNDARISGGIIGDRTAVLPDIVLISVQSNTGKGNRVQDAQRALASFGKSQIVRHTSLQGTDAIFTPLSPVGISPGFDPWTGMAFPRDDLAVIVISFKGQKEAQKSLSSALIQGRSNLSLPIT